MPAQSVDRLLIIVTPPAGVNRQFNATRSGRTLFRSRSEPAPRPLCVVPIHTTMLIALAAFVWLVAIAVFRHIRAALIIAAVLFAYVLGCGWLGEPPLRALENRTPIAGAPEYAGRVAIVMLGSGTEHDGAHRLVPNSDALRRIAAAARQYVACKARGAACTLIVSGGNPQRHEQAEADNYRPYLIERGVAPADIVLERKSLTTYENASYVSTILHKAHYDQVILLSSAYQLPRALLDFHRFGIDPLPSASNRRSVPPSWQPTFTHIVNTNIAWHEWIGIAQFHVYQRLGWF
jgi:uncharacterized SAM-binding protein YcdF (DUF218 family)